MRCSVRSICSWSFSCIDSTMGPAKRMQAPLALRSMVDCSVPLPPGNAHHAEGLREVYLFVAVVAATLRALNLQHIAFSGDHLVQHGIDEKSDEQAGDETGHDDDGEWPLSIRSNARGEGRRQ